MEHKDPCRHQAQWSPRSNVKVAMARGSSISREWKIPDTPKLVKMLSPHAIMRTTDAFRQWPISLDCSRVSIPLERSYAERSGAFLREQKYYLITNSNFWQNIGKQKHTLYTIVYNLQPVMNTFFTIPASNTQAIKLLQQISKYNVRYDVI